MGWWKRRKKKLARCQILEFIGKEFVDEVIFPVLAGIVSTAVFVIMGVAFILVLELMFKLIRGGGIGKWIVGIVCSTHLLWGIVRWIRKKIQDRNNMGKKGMA